MWTDFDYFVFESAPGGETAFDRRTLIVAEHIGVVYCYPERAEDCAEMLGGRQLSWAEVEDRQQGRDGWLAVYGRGQQEATG